MNQKLLVLSCMLLSFGCSSQNIIQDVSLQIRYEAKTRGVSKIISFQRGVVQSDNNGEKKTVVLSKDQINQIYKTIASINLKEINSLESPTKKRYTDGALFASLSIQTKEGNYTSNEFDDGVPPDELKPIYELLKKYSQ